MEPTSPSPVTVHLFGAVHVKRDGLPVELGGRKARGVLAVLAMHPGQPVSPTALAQGVWGDDAPPSAPATLRTYLSRLRSAVGPDLVVRGRSGYRLELDPQAIDLHQLRDLVRRAKVAVRQDVAGAAGLAEAAVAYCQEPPLADVRDLPFTQSVAPRLELERLSAFALLFELRLRLGEDHSVLAALQDLVHEHPTFEPLTAQLMLAQYRTGSQAAALATFTRLREVLVRELGVEPGPEAQALHVAVLNHDPTLHVAPRTARRGNLPAPAAPIVGREEELDALRALLEREHHVSVVGPRGIGKTRLAVELAASLAPRDGAWLVDLSGVTQPESVVPVVAAALQVAEQLSAPREALLVEALRQQDAVIILDGYEQVRSACAQLVEALAGCPRLRILATGVVPLLEGDAQVFRVGPLSTVAPAAAPGTSPAVALLRATGNHGDATPEALDRIAEAVGGVPLELELARSHLETMSAHELAEVLERPGGTLEWAIAQLDDDERRALHRLAVFPASFTASAATVVVAGPVEQSLLRLERRSLLSLVSSRGALRYQLPRAARELLSPRLDHGARWRQAESAVELAERAAPRLRGPDSVDWLHELDVEQPSLRAGLEWAIDHRPSDALRIVQALGWYWYRRVRIHEGRKLATAALAAAPPSVQQARTAEWRGACVTAALLANLDGDLRAMGEHLERAAASAGDRPSGAWLVTSSWHALLTGRLERARDLAQSAHRTARDRRSPADEAEALIALGMVTRAEGSSSAASEVLAQAGEVAASARHRWAAATAAWLGAKAAFDRGDLREAHRLHMECIRIAVASDDLPRALLSLHALACVVACTGDSGRGARLLGAVSAAGERIGCDPLRMDPQDAAVYARTVRAGLTDGEFRAAFREGRDLSWSSATLLAR